MCDAKSLREFKSKNLNYENPLVNFHGFEKCNLKTCIDFLRLQGKKLILVETGPTATKEYYENLIDYDFNPIDTLYIAECVSP